ncbi:aromatic-ring-hydroxylating dioxygenase subunit beta [Pseudonocardia acidicola]|uniref:Aromatic-ring-hydroxylating dioxygenase subunit beta n=1 Tax=Pseudonocardia acidicola TaxID=2724939 RepID=A0ABX1SAI4_9PSEU|nr:aromatic-ring-hydroxylating dioxygenase subunit beta [Pseudonocardia acidicola]NMH97366.1 aromatic-ring-hydroxylating dioxygenase subunit beta [Pseudonocardia acidicola]
MSTVQAEQAVAAGGVERGAAEALLFREARLLDAADHRGWLDLLTEDVVYWIPSWHCESELVDDTSRDVSLLLLDRSGLEDYATRALSGHAHVMDPPGRTDRLVSNVMVDDPAQGVVHCKWLLHLYRGGRQEIFGGSCEYRLRRENGQLKIASKKVVLTNDGIRAGFLPLV